MAGLYPLIVAFLVLSILEPPLKADNSTGMDDARLKRIAGRMKEFVDSGSIAGAVTLVSHHRTIMSLDAVGCQDLQTKEPMRKDTIFQIMSMTKPITATAVMILVEEGRLSPGDPVEKYLPEFKSMWVVGEHDDVRRLSLRRPARAITIRDLLTHTSGMYHDPPPVFSDLRYFAGLTLKEIVQIGSQQPLDFDPGTAWQYSDIGFAALGRIIEIVSGQPFDKFIQSRIFAPLGMVDSYLFPPAEKWARIATPYVLESGKLRPMAADTWGGGDLLHRKGTKYSFPEGGAYSTASDLAALYQMFLRCGIYNGTRILSKSTIELMTEVHTAALPAGHEPGTGYGFGWEIVEEPLGRAFLPGESIGSYWHAGAFGTYGWVDPSKDLFGILLMQRSPGSAGEERNAFVAIVNSAVIN